MHLKGVITDSLKSSIVHDKIKSNHLIISANFFLNTIYSRCLNTQLRLYNFDPKFIKETTDQKHQHHLHRYDKQKFVNFNTHRNICLNHYTLFIDTIFRCVSLSILELNRLCERFGAKHIIFENDLTICTLPKKLKTWNKLTKSYMNNFQIYILVINRMRILSKLLCDDMLSDLNTWEQHLMKDFHCYNFAMHYPEYRIREKYQYKDVGNIYENIDRWKKMANTKYAKYAFKLLHETYYLLGLTQEHLEPVEIYKIFEYTLDTLSKMKHIRVMNIRKHSGKHDVNMRGGHDVNMYMRASNANIHVDNSVDVHGQRMGQHTSVDNSVDVHGQHTCADNNTDMYMRASNANIYVDSTDYADILTQSASKDDSHVKSTRKSKYRRKHKNIKRPINNVNTLRPLLTLKLNTVPSYELFSYKIITQLPQHEKVIFISNQFVSYTNCFIFNFKHLYYPKLILAQNYDIASDHELVKYERSNMKIIDYYDFCNELCMDRILDCYDYMTMELFSHIERTYKYNTIHTIKPNRFDMEDYGWITKELYQQFMPGVIAIFNNVFKAKCV